MSDLAAAEEGVCGALFLDATVYEKSGLDVHHFFNPRLAEVWKAAGVCYEAGRPLDAITVGDAMGSRLEPCGGYAYLSSLVVNCPTSSNALHWAEIVRRHWILRQTQQAASDALEKARHGVDPQEILDGLTGQTRAIWRHMDRGAVTLRDAVNDMTRRIVDGRQEQGLPTGLGLESVVPGGVPKGKLTVFFAGPGTFKTTIKGHMLRFAAWKGNRVLDATFEDDRELAAARHLSVCSGVPYGEIVGGTMSDEQRVQSTRVQQQHLEYLPRIIVDDELEPTVAAVARRAKQLANEDEGLDAVFIDYIQVLSGHTDPARIDSAIREAKQLAADLHIPVIVFSQQKGDIAARSNPRPRKEDCIGSSSFEMHAKLMVGQFRPSDFWSEPNLDPTRGNDDIEQGEWRGCLELWVVKNVLGAGKARCRVIVDPPTGRILKALPFQGGRNGQS